MPIETKDVLKKISEKPSEERKATEAAEAVTPTTPTHPTDETKVANLIHKYSVYHAGVAFALGPIAGIALTPMTLNMISKLMDLCGYNKTAVQDLTKSVMRFIALLAGIGFAQLIVGLIPGIGNLKNAISSFVVIQIIGWATVKLSESNFSRKFENIDKDEWKEIIDKIFVFKYMSEDEKKRFAGLLERLFKDAQIDEAKTEIGNIVTEYKKRILNMRNSDQINKDLTKTIEGQFKAEWNDLANDADYQEIETKLLDIVRSEQFQKVCEEDKTEFARNMQILLGTSREKLDTFIKNYLPDNKVTNVMRNLLGYTDNEQRRRTAENKMKKILERYGIPIEF